MFRKTSLKACLLLENQGKYLFLEQTHKNGGRFTLLGGKVESKEFAISTLVREAQEEAGITIEEANLNLVHVLQECNNKKNKIVLLFKTNNWSGEVRSAEPKKFKALSWFALDALPENISTRSRCALDRFHQGKTFTTMNTVEVSSEIIFEHHAKVA